MLGAEDHVAPIALDGKALAQQLEAELAAAVAELRARGVQPCLAAILVGDDPASHTYVRMKRNACARAGIESRFVHLGADTTTARLRTVIDELNRDSTVHGILLQHPVPHQIDERSCFDAIALAKDVDGVTAAGYGRVAFGLDAYPSATPAGIMMLLRHYEVPLAGRRAVVVGRSAILGRPLAALLLVADATVTVCHSKTVGLPDIVKTADLVVGAVGKPRFIRGEWIRDGAVVIDAGYHPGQVGDVELDAVKDRASYWTPVPGGVGPMTIAMLLRHTVTAAKRAANSATSGAATLDGAGTDRKRSPGS